MTFIKENYFKSSSETSSPSQLMSTTYTEIEGSKTSIEKINISSDLYYFFSFSTMPKDLEKTFLHVKLQKSNDDFSSNIVDVTNCN